MRVAWVAPKFETCGIRDYALELWSEVQPRIEKEGGKTRFQPLEELHQTADVVSSLAAFAPDLIHFQHEYGSYGRKIPVLYRFPRWVKALRQRLPEAKLVATAHTVLPPGYAFPLAGRGWQAPVRAVANHALLPFLRKTWGEGTWGVLDGVIVHSRLQVPWVASTGCPDVLEIAHYAPAPRPLPVRAAGLPSPAQRVKKLMVFGFLSPEKGQHVAIEALARLPADWTLVLAGGPRRAEERAYEARCRKLAETLRVTERVQFLGFVPPERVDETYAQADLVLAPFTETTGSGSVLQSLRRGTPTLVSDHPINRELASRVPDCVDFFKLGDASDLARKAQELLNSPLRLRALSEGALAYVRSFGLRETAVKHLAFYRSVLEEKTQELSAD